jgi:hypothetical protein
MQGGRISRRDAKKARDAKDSFAAPLITLAGLTSLRKISPTLAGTPMAAYKKVA